MSRIIIIVLILALAAVAFYFLGRELFTAPTPNRVNDVENNDVANEEDEIEETALNIYFIERPQSLDDFTHVVAVERATTREDVAAFSMEQLIEGPTQQEEERGLATELEFQEDSRSQCGGPDFTIAIENETAVVRLCRYTETFGTTGGDARVATQIEETMLQFATVDNVVILDPDENCFGDRSGMNLCYDELPPDLVPSN
jgi:hypothetical protein